MVRMATKARDLMNAVPGSDQPDDVSYPESDGKPMAETPLHRDEMNELIFRLRHHFAADPSVYVSGNMMLYYEQGNPAACFSPDVFVALGAGNAERRVYKLWAEACGPTVVFEISSRSTSLEDEGNKKVLCQRLGVQEYWLYDPEGEYLAPRLQGYRLKAWHYLPIVAEADGSLVSTVLGLRLGLAGSLLDVFDDASGDRLLCTGETDSARVIANEEAALERTARLNAEQQVISALAEQAAAEERAAAADDRATAAETEALKPKVIERTVSGPVVVATRRYLAVEFAQTKDASEEMLLPVNEDTVYERLKGIQDLNRGDRVKVVYEQTYLPSAEAGGEPRILKTVAKTVSLVKRVVADAIQSPQPKTGETE